MERNNHATAAGGYTGVRISTDANFEQPDNSRAGCSSWKQQRFLIDP